MDSFSRVFLPYPKVIAMAIYEKNGTHWLPMLRTEKNQRKSHAQRRVTYGLISAINPCPSFL
jgi:hypothetical protein